jgi:hypothetical protein
MPAIARGQTSDCTNPIIDLFTRFGSTPTDVHELSYQIFEKVSFPTPLQVYPVSGRQTVDLTDCPSGDRIDPGHYVARWTVPDAEALGTHEIRWFFKSGAMSPEQSFTEEFEVTDLLVGAIAQEYATVQQLRDEGVTTTQASDSVLHRKIVMMSALINRWTGRWFYPRSMTLLLDGNNADTLMVGPPIISVSAVTLLDQGNVITSDTVVELSDIRIYNRHLTQQLLDPDDRNNPKLQWLRFDGLRHHLPGIVSAGFFPRGTQNIRVVGYFGYTDPDGTPSGKTPDLINYACMQLVVRDLPKLTDFEARDEQAMRGRVTSLRTRDQSITWAAPGQKSTALGSSWSGDPAIDSIIASYRRPPTFGAV